MRCSGERPCDRATEEAKTRRAGYEYRRPVEPIDSHWEAIQSTVGVRDRIQWMKNWSPRRFSLRDGEQAGQEFSPPFQLGAHRVQAAFRRRSGGVQVPAQDAAALVLIRVERPKGPNAVEIERGSRAPGVIGPLGQI